MAAIPPMLEAQVNRMYSKGTKFQYGVGSNAFATIPTQWASLAGVVKIGGPDKKRQGPVDLTELAPQTGFDGAEPNTGGSGIFPPDAEAGATFLRTAESYYNAKYGPGTKDAQPIPVTMNFPRDILFYLNYWFDNDVFLWWRILYTNGAFNRFYGFIDEISTTSEDNKLVSGDVTFRPLERVIFNPASGTPPPSPPGAF